MRSVVYSATRNLYWLLPYAYKSLLEHTNVDRIYILAEDDNIGCDVPENVKVIDVSGQDIFPKSGPNYRSQFTHMALMRAAYSSLFPNEDLMLQLDVDTIVTGDISELWDKDYSGSYISCTNEYYGTYRPYGREYFNIGVCMFNLKKMREDGIDKKLIEILNAEAFTYIEQDALNLLCKGKILPMESRFNATRFTGHPEDTRIEHFAGVMNWWNDARYKELIAPQ